VRVSVVIPCYNSTAHLGETVESVLAQTAADFEIILVDDGSTDDTRALCARLVATHAGRRITLICQANRGVAGARNCGIAAARAPYVLPLDADDLIAPTMLEQCAHVLDVEPQAALVFCDREDFGALDGVWRAGHYELERLKYFNQIPYCTMFRRAMWETIGGYRVNVSGFDDWDFWLAAAARGFRGRHLPAPLLRHRRHPSSQLHGLVASYERLYATIILNNREVYSDEEVAVAERFVATGEAAPLLRAAKQIFLSRYPLVPAEAP
jgi:glycosyltransferase involved in cell wall biosynthesis